MIDHYAWSGGREAMLRFGPREGAPVVVVAMPLFEEANRTRAFVVTICRALADRGVASVLPDLPGQGESLVPLESRSLVDIALGYQAAVEAVSTEHGRVYGVAIRSGALLDDLASLDGRWHFAPQDGLAVLRELTRIKQASLAPATKLDELWYLDDSLPEHAPDPPVEIAGNLVSVRLLTDLTVSARATIEDGAPVRTIRLAGDPRAADRSVEGTPLWRRSEPGNDPALAALLADDIAEWIARCEG